MLISRASKHSDFHKAGLDCGRVPLDVLDAVIDRYIARARAA